MARVQSDSALSTILRRKWIVIVTVLFVTVATAVASKALPKVYSTNATLLVALTADRSSFDSVQASQAIARSYADIIKSPNIAQLVATRLADGTTKRDVAHATDFEPVAQTQLLSINAEDRSPARAKRIADTYAVVFIDYARTHLQRTTGASTSLADAAPLPGSAARPKPTIYTLIAAVLGLALGVTLAFLVERLDRRLRTPEDVEGQFDVPVLARVPRRGRSDVSITAFKEAMRILRTNLQFARTDGPLKSIAITSAQAGEGKTTMVANLGIACAEIGLDVVVVEGDLRRPALQRELLPDDPTPLRPGLSNYLVETLGVDEVRYPAGRSGVDLIPAGPLPPSPSALLESQRAREAVSAFTADADLVLIDCPPLSIGADASVISRWVDGVLVVIDLNASTDRAVREALRQLEAVKAPVIGLLLNRDRSAETSRYEYYTRPQSGEDERALTAGGGPRA
jgi:capsular exopolysaccharide synthesis family protein